MRFQLSANAGQNNFTFFGARPTQGVFQVKGMDELDVDTYYGAYTRSVTTAQSAGELRVLALGYIDHRTLVLKTDNRPSSVRAADLGKVEIATWGRRLRPCLQHHPFRQVRFSALGCSADRFLG